MAPAGNAGALSQHTKPSAAPPEQGLRAAAHSAVTWSAKSSGAKWEVPGKVPLSTCGGQAAGAAATVTLCRFTKRRTRRGAAKHVAHHAGRYCCCFPGLRVSAAPPAAPRGRPPAARPCPHQGRRCAGRGPGRARAHPARRGAARNVTLVTRAGAASDRCTCQSRQTAATAAACPAPLDTTARHTHPSGRASGRWKRAPPGLLTSSDEAERTRLVGCWLPRNSACCREAVTMSERLLRAAAGRRGACPRHRQAAGRASLLP